MQGCVARYTAGEEQESHLAGHADRSAPPGLPPHRLFVRLVESGHCLKTLICGRVLSCPAAVLPIEKGS